MVRSRLYQLETSKKYALSFKTRRDLSVHPSQSSNSFIFYYSVADVVERVLDRFLLFNFNETTPKPKLDWTILNDSQLDELGLFSIIRIRYNSYTICNLISEISNVFVFIANQVGTTVGAGAGLLGAHRGPWYFQLLVVIDFESFCEPLMRDQSNLVSGPQTSFTDLLSST